MLHKALEGAIILESFPKTTVDVFALVLESGGSKFLYIYNVIIFCFGSIVIIIAICVYMSLVCTLQNKLHERDYVHLACFQSFEAFVFLYVEK